MTKKSDAKKDNPDVRTDASGRELREWEVSPEEQVGNPIADETDEAPEEAPEGPKHNEN